MSRLRRQSSDSCGFVVAAEVLENRSLLSASVHAAVAHAQQDVHSTARQPVSTVVFPTSYNARADIQGTFQGQTFEILGMNFRGTFHGATAPVQAGKSVKIGINQTNINQSAGPFTLDTVKGRIGGKIDSVRDIGPGAHELAIVPSGHLAVTATVSGQTVRATLAGTAAPFLLDVTGDGTAQSPYHFTSLLAHCQVTKPKGTGGSVDLFITPAPVSG